MYLKTSCLFLSLYFSHVADEEEEEKKGKKSSKEKPAASGKKDPVTYVSDSGEGCLGNRLCHFRSINIWTLRKLVLF